MPGKTENAGSASGVKPTLELLLDRLEYAKDYTIGSLLVSGKFACWTIEDTVRQDPNPATPANEAKVRGKTAIPAGRYRVVISRSPRFKKDLPELLNVPGFAGIRIHAGNTAADTEGCIIVGLQRGTAKVLQSRPAMIRLQADIQEAIADGREVWITINQ